MPIHPLHNEKELLIRVAAGDEQAFTEVYYHYQNIIFFIALRMTRSEVLAEEVLQEVFIKLWVNNRALGEVEHFRAYLYTLTRNHIYNVLRKMAHEEAVIRELGLQGNPSGADVPDGVLIGELQELLQQEMAKLSPQQQRVFRMGKLEGLKHEEIAAALNISRETVKKHMMEAVRHIRDGLGGREGFSALLLAALVAAARTV